MRPKCIVLDIDGCIIHHHGSLAAQITNEPSLLLGTIDKLNEWDKKGYHIILLTGRRESLRDITKEQLSNLGIFYDQLVMGIGGGDRVLINDRKLDKQEDTAFAVNLERNKGIGDVEI